MRLMVHTVAQGVASGAQDHTVLGMGPHSGHVHQFTSVRVRMAIYAAVLRDLFPCFLWLQVREPSMHIVALGSFDCCPRLLLSVPLCCCTKTLWGLLLCSYMKSIDRYVVVAAGAVLMHC